MAETVGLRLSGRSWSIRVTMMSDGVSGPVAVWSAQTISPPR